MQLQGAMLFVRDLGRMEAFYSGVLGLTPIEKTRMENWVEFDTGSARFALHAIPREIAQYIEISSPPQLREKNPVKLSFEAPDVERERIRLEGLGVTTLIRPWGAWEAVDPEGNIFQLSAPRVSSNPKP